MSAFASCGHEVADLGDLVAAEFDDADYDWDSGQLVPTVIYGVYCPACAKQRIEDGTLRLTVDPAVS